MPGGDRPQSDADLSEDVLRLFSTVQAIEPSASKPDRGVVTLFMETLNQNDQVVQRATGKLLVFRRPAED